MKDNMRKQLGKNVNFVNTDDDTKMLSGKTAVCHTRF